MKNVILLIFCVGLFFSCQQKSGKAKVNSTENQIPIEYAKGFSLSQHKNFKILHISQPWANSEKTFTYILRKKGIKIPDSLNYDAVIDIPLQRVVATSTTHIPGIERLGETESLVGFPNLDLISSEKTRNRIKNGKIKELGKNESLNSEVLVALDPDAIIAFSVDSQNKSLQQAQRAGIPVIYNGDWTEENPLGKAEWIKFFGALYGKLDKAETQFKKIESAYRKAVAKVAKVQEKPLVLAGSLYKDSWYLPYGNSWQGKMIADAGGNYLYGDTQGKGSISLSFEEVLNKGRGAEIWIAPGSFESYTAMKEASEHYTEFKAFQEHNIFTMASTKGETGGVLYYELAPQRPDLVVKDLIKIFHPGKLNGYEPVFFKPLQK